MINPHISFKPYSLRKGNNHFVKRQMYALKQANSRLSNQRERERVKTPGKIRSVKRNSMKYRRRKYDLYDNINSCITFQAASTRDDINSYHNEIRDSGNSHIQNFKKFNIFENIAVPDAKFDIFRGTPDSTATKGYNVNGFKEFDLIMNNKFNSALKKSITNEQFKRRHMIKHNQEITSLKKLHDERNRKAINSKGQSQNPPQINSRSLIAKKSCNKKVIVPWSRTSQNQKNISCDVEIKRERPSGFKMKIKKENCYDSLSKNSLNQTKLYQGDPNSKMNIVENEQSEQKPGSRKNTDGSEHPEADGEKSTSAGGNKVKLDLRDLVDVKDTNGAFPEKRFNEEGSWDQDKKFIEIYKQHLKESKVISSSRTDLRIQEKTNEYDSNYVKTSYGIKFLDTKETSDLLLTNSSNKNLSAREFIKQKSHKSHDSAVKAVGLPQIMSTSPYRKKARLLVIF
ncbi:unnamed protein product [Moneuplotes crassus]|uniref:Uncharacterized protein n=1 Tax=Euplotes crassus TaxID=5936 RepID=A0AAD1X851_EUPCR|nr:unnamed protein product [Moneuplotes crassus]